MIKDERVKKVLRKDLNVYSTDEQVIGTWIDGKPLYRKIIYLSSLPSTPNTDVSLQHGIANVDRIWLDIANSFIVIQPNNSNSDIAPIPYVKTNNNQLVIDMINFYGINRNLYVCFVSRDRSSSSAYLAFKYTKTTD